MVDAVIEKQTGAENVIWDLSVFYSGADDPAIQRDMEQVHNKAEVLIEKQRHGPTGKIDLFFEGEFTRFADLDMMHDG